MVLLIGCTSNETPSNNKILNHTSPKLSISNVLPTASSNTYCNPSLDSDILYGIGYDLFNKEKYTDAKNCLIMAAPQHDRAFCYLAIIAQYDEKSTKDQRNTEAFNYIAYSASKNDWCAEYGMYENYKYGIRGAKQDKTLALSWLERSAKHGYPEAQELIKTYHYKQGNLPLSYAWSKILGLDTNNLEKETHKNMTKSQINESKKLYEELKKIVTPKEILKNEALMENIAFLSASIHLNHPETFKNVSSAERYSFIKKAITESQNKSKLKTTGEIESYVVVARHAQKRQPGADILANPEIIKILKNSELTTSQKIESSLIIANTIYK